LALRWQRAQQIDPASIEPLGLGWYVVPNLPALIGPAGSGKTYTALTPPRTSCPGGRIAVNLAPVGRRQEGPAYNLPIAAALLALDGQMLCELDGVLFVGGLSLDGAVLHPQWRPS